MRSHLQINSGIALAPILFVVALLAVLVAALAAGSGGFSTNIGRDNARIMATSLIHTCTNYKLATQRMVNGSCNPQQLDVNPRFAPGGTSWMNGDFTSGNGTNRNGNGQCAFYHPNGGAIQFQTIAAAALDTDSSRTNSLLSDAHYGHPQMANWFGYPMLSGTHCILNVGDCTAANTSRNAFLTMSITPIEPSVCQAINDQLGNGIIAANHRANINDSAINNMQAGGNLRSGTTTQTSGGILTPAQLTNTEFCGRDNRAWNGGPVGMVTSFTAYVYYCTVMLR